MIWHFKDSDLVWRSIMVNMRWYFVVFQISENHLSYGLAQLVITACLCTVLKCQINWILDSTRPSYGPVSEGILVFQNSSGLNCASLYPDHMHKIWTCPCLKTPGLIFGDWFALIIINYWKVAFFLRWVLSTSTCQLFFQWIDSWLPWAMNLTNVEYGFMPVFWGSFIDGHGLPVH